MIKSFARKLRNSSDRVLRKFAQPDARSAQDVLKQTISPAKKPTSLQPLVSDPPSLNAEVRLLVFADGNGATQRISFERPLREVRDAGLVQLTILSESDFEQYLPREADRKTTQAIESLNPTHVVVSRFGGRGVGGIIQACRALEIEYVMHLDDNLFEIPESIGAAKYEKYSDPARLARLRLLCERAGRVYASTRELSCQLENLGIKPEIVAGEIYCAADGEFAAYGGSSTPIIGYMGTSGHTDDLRLVIPAIRAIMSKYDTVRFETFGSIKMPKDLIKAFPDRVHRHKAAGSYDEFIAQFGQMAWTCGLAPLQPTEFNGCKANTKYIEYTQAGIPCVASDFVVYQSSIDGQNGVLANSVEDWTRAIEDLISNQDLALAMVSRAQSDARNKWSRKKLFHQLVKVLDLPTTLRQDY